MRARPPRPDAALIDAYLRDRLDEAGRREFEYRLLDDPWLLEQVELELVLRITLPEPALLRALLGPAPAPLSGRERGRS